MNLAEDALIRAKFINNSIHLATPAAVEGKGNVKLTAVSSQNNSFAFFFVVLNSSKVRFQRPFSLTRFIMVFEELEESEGVIAFNWYEKGIFRLWEFADGIKGDRYCGENMSGRCSICKKTKRGRYKCSTNFLRHIRVSYILNLVYVFMLTLNFLHYHIFTDVSSYSTCKLGN